MATRATASCQYAIDLVLSVLCISVKYVYVSSITSVTSLTRLVRLARRPVLVSADQSCVSADSVPKAMTVEPELSLL